MTLRVLILILLLTTANSEAQSWRFGSVNVGAEKLNAIASSGNGIWGGVGNFGLYRQLTTGSSKWTNRVLAEGQFFSGIAFSGRNSIIVGSQILTSTNEGSTWERTHEPTDTLRSVAISNGWSVTVGDRASILYSQDVGKTWKSVKVSKAATLRSVAVLGGRAVAVGDKGLILSSVDSGRTWNVAEVGQASNLDKVTTNGEYWLATGKDWAAFRSANGIDWEAIQIDQGSATSIPLADVQLSVIFNNGEALLSVFEPGLLWSMTYRSSDGIHWSQTPTQAPLDQALTSFGSSGDTVIVSTGFASMVTTTNKGEDWKSTYFPTTTIYVAATALSNEVACIGRNKNRIDYSTDGGGSWSDITPSDKLPNFNCAIIPKSQSLIIGLDSGSLLRTTNGGTNWNRISLPTNTKVSLISSQGGIVDLVQFPNRIMTSSDDGLSWKLLADMSEPINDITRYDEVTLAVVSSTGRVYVTSSNGKEWNDVSPGLPGSNITQQGKETWIAGTSSGTDIIQHSASLGEMWTVQMQSSEAGIADLSAIKISGNLGLAGGGFGKVFSSTNGGATWLKQDPSMLLQQSTAAIVSPSPGILILLTSAGTTAKLSNESEGIVEHHTAPKSVFFPNPASRTLTIVCDADLSNLLAISSSGIQYELNIERGAAGMEKRVNCSHLDSGCYVVINKLTRELLGNIVIQK